MEAHIFMLLLGTFCVQIGQSFEAQWYFKLLKEFEIYVIFLRKQRFYRFQTFFKDSTMKLKEQSNQIKDYPKMHHKKESFHKYISWQWDGKIGVSSWWCRGLVLCPAIFCEWLILTCFHELSKCSKLAKSIFFWLQYFPYTSFAPSTIWSFFICECFEGFASLAFEK